MYLVIDIGNTNVKFGLYEDRELIASWRTYSSLQKTSDEYGIELTSFLRHVDCTPDMVEGVMISSVKVSINYTFEHMCSIYFNVVPVFVSHELDTGIKILYDNPKVLGADRIVNAVAAYELYGGPCITIDFGTATTFGCISRNGEFIGGAICPGVRVSSDAMTETADLLPSIEFVKPPSIINTNTISAMQSGIIYGSAGQVDYILKNMLEEMNCNDAYIIATGGLSKVIGEESKYIKTINSLLTLEGLSIVYLRNQ